MTFSHNGKPNIYKGSLHMGMPKEIFPTRKEWRKNKPWISIDQGRIRTGGTWISRNWLESSIPGRKVTWYRLNNKLWVVSYNTKHLITIPLSICTLEYLSMKNQNLCLLKTCTGTVITAVDEILNPGKNPDVFPPGNNTQNVVHPYHGLVLDNKNKELLMHATSQMNIQGLRLRKM